MKIVKVAAGLLLSGCVLLDPTYPSRTSPVYEDGGKFPEETSPKPDPDKGGLTDDSTSLRRAFNESVAMQQTYLKAASRHDLARSITGPAVVGGSAYALLMGISPGIAPKNAADQIAAIGTGGAALYGTSSFLISAKRQDVYIAGAKAISCLQERTRPFLLSRDAENRLSSALFGQVRSAHAENTARDLEQDQLVQVGAARVSLRTLARGASMARAGVLATGAGSIYPDKPLSNLRSVVLRLIDDVEGEPGYGSDAAARKHVDAARALAGASTAAETKGLSLLAEIDGGAAQSFTIALRKIDIGVAQELRKTQPELSTILTIIDGLGAISGKIAGRSLSAPATTAPSGTQNSRRGDQVKADMIEALKRAMADLQYSVDLIDGVVSSVVERVKAVGQEIRGDQTPTVVRLGDCVMAPIDMSLRTDKSELAFKQGAASTASLKIEGGEWPFVARFEGSPAGLSVTQSPEFGRTITVAYDGKGSVIPKDPKEPPAQLKVTDKFGAAAPPVAVKIEAAPANNTAPPAPQVTLPSSPLGESWKGKESFYAKLSEMERQFLPLSGAQKAQKALCLTTRGAAADGDFGKSGDKTNTRLAIAQFRTDLGRSGDTLQQDEIELLLSGPDCDGPSRSWYERRLVAKGRMDSVLSKFGAGFDAPKLNDDGVRQAIKAVPDATAKEGYDTALTRVRCIVKAGTDPCTKEIGPQ
ncbi:MAG: hypothetical protein ABL957_12125 [Parvularculaceae bacterium]